MKLPSLIPLGSMGLVYLPLNLQYKSAIHVSKHINHMDPMAAGLFGFTCPKDIFQARSNGNVSWGSGRNSEGDGGALRQALRFCSIQGMILVRTKTLGHTTIIHICYHFIAFRNCCSVNFCEYMCMILTSIFGTAMNLEEWIISSIDLLTSARHESFTVPHDRPGLLGMCCHGKEISCWKTPRDASRTTVWQGHLRLVSAQNEYVHDFLVRCHQKFSVMWGMTHTIHGVGIFAYMDDWFSGFSCRWKYTIHGCYLWWEVYTKIWSSSPHDFQCWISTTWTDL